MGEHELIQAIEEFSNFANGVRTVSECMLFLCQTVRPHHIF